MNYLINVWFLLQSKMLLGMQMNPSPIEKKKNGDCVPYLGDAWVAAAKVVSPVVHPVLLRRRAVLA